MASNDTPAPTCEVVLVFLDDEEDKLYQLKQWVQPLERLAHGYRVEVWHASGHAAELLAGTSLKAVRLRNAEAVQRELLDRAPRVFLYVNQSLKNAQTLRHSGSVHVFVSHGESDKAYMYQNTIKRFDLCFAAGDAAKRRLSRNVDCYDVDQRVVLIGRPQILDRHEVPDDFPVSDLIRVIYAPTWEGVTTATRYSSIASHGQAIVRSLLDHGGYQVVYRPHPLSGTRDGRIRTADHSIRRMVQTANEGLAQPLHYVDSSTFGWQLGTMDAMITDISAVAYDWLATGKALMLTRPVESKAVLDDFLLIRELRPMDVTEAPRAAELLDRARQEAGSDGSPLKALLHHYFGEPGVCDDSRFESAIRHALDLQTKLPMTNSAVAAASRLESSRIRLYLHKFNIWLRRFWTWCGIWNLNSALEKIPNRGGDVHVYFSSAFATASPRKALKRMLESTPDQIVIGTNHVLTWLWLNAMATIRGRTSVRIMVLPLGTAGACEKIVRALKPHRMIYLKHDAANHMMLRSNGMRHTLWHPETDPDFECDHTLVTYDEIITTEPKTRQQVGGLLEISQPMLSPGIERRPDR